MGINTVVNSNVLLVLLLTFHYYDKPVFQQSVSRTQYFMMESIFHRKHLSLHLYILQLEKGI